MLIHFPIVLFFLTAVGSIVAQDRHADWIRAGLLFSFLTGGLSVLSGLNALSRLSLTGFPATLLTWHFALAFTWLAAVAALYFLPWRHWTARVMFLVATLLLITVGTLGGTLVYHYGVGVRSPAPATTAGQILFDARCSRCHGPGQGHPFSRDTIKRLGGVPGLARFIERNMPPDQPHPGPAESRLIAEFLAR